ncbi:hypothetical protein J1605_016771 [Eschrichtius robustus]|uniref:VWFC domain-containing protein n=1 Tax=Eschrichtius robustus TaxID=9764 RepID=A0AB34I1R8_ESCRO|nr:hypothetical protein J1605_016771 [Eschrichtius robustus]
MVSPDGFSAGLHTVSTFLKHDFVVQKPELSTPSICHAPGGEYFVEGETWHIDTCTQCTCHSGRVLCETEVCPPLLCQNPTRTQDSCCPQCPGNRHCASGCTGPAGRGCSLGIVILQDRWAGLSPTWECARPSHQ